MFVHKPHGFIYTASVMATYFIVMSYKPNPPFVNVKLYRIIEKKLFVQNMIATDEESKTEVAGQCVPCTYLCHPTYLELNLQCLCCLFAI
jgi:hypothetical protein